VRGFLLMAKFPALDGSTTFRRVRIYSVPFAGIGGWSYALAPRRLARRPTLVDRILSVPTVLPQRKRKGIDDERHLWPVFFKLIRACRPAVVMGEQVASKDGLGWLDAVHADLEGAGYARGCQSLRCGRSAAHQTKALVGWSAAGRHPALRAGVGPGVSREVRTRPAWTADGKKHTASPEHAVKFAGWRDAAGAGHERRR